MCPYAFKNETVCIRCSVRGKYHCRINPLRAMELGIELRDLGNIALLENRPCIQFDMLIIDKTTMVNISGMNTWSTNRDFATALRAQHRALGRETNLDTYFQGKVIVMGDRALRVSRGDSHLLLTREEIALIDTDEPLVIIETKRLNDRDCPPRSAMGRPEGSLSGEPLCTVCWSDMGFDDYDTLA